MSKIIVILAAIILVTPAMAESTTQRDAPTTRFYDSRGNVTGSATTYGNQTKFYASDGKVIGSTTRSNKR